MREKVATLHKAAFLVRDGDAVVMTTSVLEDAPMALLREVIRQGRGDLCALAITGGGFNLDLLIASGAVSSVDLSSISLGPLGQAPNFQRRVKAGKLRVRDNTCGVMYTTLQAAAMGSPFVPVRGLIGTDLLKHRDDFKVISNPFNPAEELVVAPAVRPDVAVFHGIKGDRFGNVLTPPHRDDLMAAQAARKVVVTVEEIVEGTLEAVEPSHGTLIPSIYVDAVVETPYGAHPTACWGRYDADMAHLKQYVEASATEEGIKEYLQRYVYGPKSHEEYLEVVGWEGNRDLSN